MLEKTLFQSMVKNTPLVSIDLVIKNTKGQALLGKRNNKPAKGFWFVPGGRILKDESLNDAFTRLVKVELGLNLNVEDSQFLGVYEHFYDDNFSGDDFSTHYVVIGRSITLDIELTDLPEDQHNDYKWFDMDSIKQNDQIHKHSKWYFDKEFKHFGS